MEGRSTAALRETEEEIGLSREHVRLWVISIRNWC